MLTATLEDVFRRIVREENDALVEKLRALVASADPSASDFLTLEEAAALSKFSTAKIRTLQRKGALKEYGDRRGIRVKRSELVAYLASRPKDDNFDPEAKAAEILARRRRG